MMNFVVPCLAQLAVCVGSDVNISFVIHIELNYTQALWKPLNYQVLLKTRNDLWKVRYYALKVIQECYLRLGEELLVLLPETMPFLSELMEDSNPEVEKLTKELIKSIEQYLGSSDSISNYL
jgi:U3 small nucleolar RNA-associated protein 10